MRTIDSWSYPEALDKEEWLVATYFVEIPPSSSIIDTAQEMAIGQTTGTWVKLPDELMNIVEAYNGRFEAVYKVPPAELKSTADEPLMMVVRIAYPFNNFDNDLSILLTVLVGNESSTSQVLKLLDIQFPPKFLAALPGPRFGIQGIRDLLGVYDRPLLNNMIKPCIGMTPEEGAKLCYETALGGVDIIKDDEKVSTHSISPIEKRVKAYKAAIQRAEEETGSKTLYIANISSQISKLRDNALRARDAGADMLLVSFLSIGLTALQLLAEDPEINLPLFAHVNIAPVWYESPKMGMSSHLVLGKLPRLAGADMVLHLSPYGKYPISLDSYKMYTRATTMPLPGIKPAFPLVAGGVHPRLVPRMVQDLGIDFVVGAGGGIQGHPHGTVAGARAMRQALEAGAKHIPLEEYAADKPELRAALEKWK
jgi:2,3-diketo-5-methylthiopentyl-1-phosphate enolase